MSNIARSTHPGFMAHVRRDVSLSIRSNSGAYAPLLFFCMVCTLVPLSISPNPQKLAELAPGIIWIMALLANLLSMERIFVFDYEDGSLEQMLIAPNMMAFPVLGKIIAHWLVTGLPLTFLSPAIGLMLALPNNAYGPMILSLAAGTAYLSLVGAVIASLTVSLGRGGFLISLLAVPLYMPILVFGTSTVTYAVANMPWSAPLATMGAMLAIALMLCPLVASWALRVTNGG